MLAHDGDAATIASAIFTNDPYYPRPSSPQWASFADAYTAEAARLGSTSAMLSQQMAAALHEQWAEQQKWNMFVRV